MRPGNAEMEQKHAFTHWYVLRLRHVCAYIFIYKFIENKNIKVILFSFFSPIVFVFSIIAIIRDLIYFYF